MKQSTVMSWIPYPAVFQPRTLRPADWGPNYSATRTPASSNDYPPGVGMIIQQNPWNCPYALPSPHKNTIFQKLVSWSELFIFLKNHQNCWIQLIRWKFSFLPTLQTSVILNYCHIYTGLVKRKNALACAKCADSHHPAHVQSFIWASALHFIHERYPMILFVDRGGPDQPVRMHRLIWAFAVHICPKIHLRMACPVSLSGPMQYLPV